LHLFFLDSQATPTAAGIAARIVQYFQDGFYPSGAANPASMSALSFTPSCDHVNHFCSFSLSFAFSEGFSPTAALVKAVLINSAQPVLYRQVDEPSNMIAMPMTRVNQITAGIPYTCAAVPKSFAFII
jgi:hypothetical protein